MLLNACPFILDVHAKDGMQYLDKPVYTARATNRLQDKKIINKMSQAFNSEIH